MQVFKLFVFLVVSGRLFHKVGPMHDKVFRPVLLLRKGCLSFAKLFLVSILQCGANSKILFRWKGLFFLTNLKVIAFLHWWTLSLVGNQFIDLNSAIDMCCILSNLRRNLYKTFILRNMYLLFCFLVRFVYQTVHA